MARKRKRRARGEQAEEQAEEEGMDLSMNTVRTIHLHGHEDHIHSEFTIFENVGSCGPAGRVWDAAVILSEYILKHFGESGMNGLRVIELGSGTGLVGILCAKLGANVILTDKYFAIPLMEANARENAADSVCEKFDLETNDVASDVVGCGDEALFPPLLKTLRQMCGPETKILMAYKPRARFEKTFFDSILESFCVRRVWHKLLPRDRYTEVFSAPVDVFEIRLRQENSSVRSARPIQMKYSNNDMNAEVLQQTFRGNVDLNDSMLIRMVK
eukprot:764668-Hanusia_phi.AAC.1